MRVGVSCFSVRKSKNDQGQRVIVCSFILSSWFQVDPPTMDTAFFLFILCEAVHLPAYLYKFICPPSALFLSFPHLRQPKTKPQQCSLSRSSLPLWLPSLSPLPLLIPQPSMARTISLPARMRRHSVQRFTSASTTRGIARHLAARRG